VHTVDECQIERNSTKEGRQLALLEEIVARLGEYRASADFGEQQVWVRVNDRPVETPIST